MNKVLQLGLQSSVVQASKFLVVVPLGSLRVGSSTIVSIRLGTTSFNKRLMSNAPAKSVPFSINNTKGKEMKGSDNNIEAMTVQELRASLRQETWTTCEGTQKRTYLNFTASYGQ